MFICYATCADEVKLVQMGVKLNTMIIHYTTCAHVGWNTVQYFVMELVKMSQTCTMTDGA